MGDDAVVAAVGRRDDDRDHLALGLREPRVAAHQLVVVGPPGEQVRRPQREDALDVRHEPEALERPGPELANLVRDLVLAGHAQPRDPFRPGLDLRHGASLAV